MYDTNDKTLDNRANINNFQAQKVTRRIKIKENTNNADIFCEINMKIDVAILTLPFFRSMR